MIQLKNKLPLILIMLPLYKTAFMGLPTSIEERNWLRLVFIILSISILTIWFYIELRRKKQVLDELPQV